MNQNLIDIVAIHRVTNHLQVLFWPLVIAMILIGLVQLRSPKTIFSVFRIAGNNAHMHLYLREGFSINSISSYLLQFNYFIVLGIFSYILVDYFSDYNEIHWDLVLVCLSAPLAYFLVKFIFISFLSFLSDTQNGFFEYLTNYKVFFQIQGIMLLPITVSLVFVDSQAQYYLALIAFSLTVLISIYRTILSFLYALRYGFSVLYIFLYLCTLEILPLVVILKLFDDGML